MCVDHVADELQKSVMGRWHGEGDLSVPYHIGLNVGLPLTTVKWMNLVCKRI